MSKVVLFTGVSESRIAGKINQWLLEHSGYRVAAMTTTSDDRSDIVRVLVAFEPVR